MLRSDLAVGRILAQRAANSPVAANELTELFQSRNLTGRASEWWLNRRGLIVLYRGQAERTVNILSPLARESGLEASEALAARLRGAGLANEDIARQTALFNDAPVPESYAPGFGGERVGGVGIPTTRLPNLAASFGQKGVVYIIRLPKSVAIRVPPWGLAVEHEYVILNQIPREAVVGTIPLSKIPPLEVGSGGEGLVPRLNWSTAEADAIAGDTASMFSRAPIHPALQDPRLPMIGIPPLSPVPDDTPRTAAPTRRAADPPGAGTTSENTFCWRPNSDYINPVCTTYKTYVVKSGDTLWDLAKKFYGDPKQYPKIYDANKGILGANQDKPRLLPGQQLNIP